MTYRLSLVFAVLVAARWRETNFMAVSHQALLTF